MDIDLKHAGFVDRRVEQSEEALALLDRLFTTKMDTGQT